MTGPRFACDEQLGRLAKWLRLQGFDTLFECPADDSQLIRQAQSEGRVLLTRDRNLEAKTLWPHVIVIEATNYGKQLHELQKKVRLPKGKAFTRCLDCNVRIEPISKEKVEGKVPEEVYKSYSAFYTCPGCRKIFWRGSHVKHSALRLRRFLG